MMVGNEDSPLWGLHDHNGNNNNNINPPPYSTLFVSSFILPSTIHKEAPLFRIGKATPSLLLEPSSQLSFASTSPLCYPLGWMNVGLLTQSIAMMDHDGGGTNMGNREPLYEAGITLNTLKQFHIFSGSLVFISSLFSLVIYPLSLNK